MNFSSPTSRIEDGLFLPEGASLFTRLRVAVRALKVLEKRPDDSVAAPLFNASLDGDVFQRLCSELAKSDDGRELLATRPSLQGSSIDLAALGRLPEGTLGNAFARYFSDNGIQPFESPYEVRNDVDYLVKWYRETHDLHHVVRARSRRWSPTSRTSRCAPSRCQCGCPPPGTCGSTGPRSS